MPFCHQSNFLFVYFQSLEALRLASLSKRFSRIEEAAKKREDFSIAVKENLEQKIEASTANRETLISDLKTKLSTHVRKHSWISA